MKHYYFLAALLPPLEIGHPAAIDFFEFKELLRSNLSDEDAAKVRHFLRWIDIENLRALWVGEPLNPRGNCTREELEEALKDLSWPGGEPFPDYLLDFLERYPQQEERVRHFSQLLSAFFNEEQHAEESFTQRFFFFERRMRLVLLGFRAKRMHKSMSAELQYEDAEDFTVAQLLAQSDASSFEPPFEFAELKPLFEAFHAEPLELHKALTAYRFSQIEALYEGDLFSIERILGYLAQLLLVEEWMELDSARGKQVVDTTMQGVK